MFFFFSRDKKNVCFKVGAKKKKLCANFSEKKNITESNNLGTPPPPQKSNGASLSFDEVQRIETSWATQLGEMRPFVPLNIISGKVTRAAGDNFNRATESLTGAHHDVVNMVLYQIASGNATSQQFANVLRHTKSRERSVHDENTNQQTLPSHSLINRAKKSEIVRHE